MIVTDKLRSYSVARSQLLPGVEHPQGRYLNNRAEDSQRPTRRRERQVQRIKSSEHAQRFLSAHAFIYIRFHPHRHITSVKHDRNPVRGFQVLAAANTRSSNCMIGMSDCVLIVCFLHELNVTHP
jgi:putative transposase